MANPELSDDQKDLSSRDIPVHADDDDLLEEIDKVLEQSSEEFVRGYVDKGGQGWSGFFDPAFFIGAVNAGLAAAMTWDLFKLTVKRTISALSQTPGPASSLLSADGELDPGVELALKEAWQSAKEFRESSVRHSLDEAETLHWQIFFREFMHAGGFVRLRLEHLDQLRRIASMTPERLSTSQLLARIIDKWLRENPNATIGIAD